MELTLFDFDGTYQNQTFYLKTLHQWITAEHLQGIHGYCEEAALKEIDSRIKRLPETKINFLGSGNYHYLSYLLQRYLKEPYDLVLFDHHTDMQPSLLPELLSCGSWVKRTFDTNKLLHKLILIGANEKAVSEIEGNYKKRVAAYSKEKLQKDSAGRDTGPGRILSFLKKEITLPIYCSIDKDVLTRREVRTNWDQGELMADQLKEILHFLGENCFILAADICGEEIYHDFYTAAFQRLIEKSSQLNFWLLHFFQTVLLGAQR